MQNIDHLASIDVLVDQIGEHLAGMIARLWIAIVHKGHGDCPCRILVAAHVPVIPEGHNLWLLPTRSHIIDHLAQGLHWQPAANGQVIDEEIGGSIHTERFAGQSVPLDHHSRIT